MTEPNSEDQLPDSAKAFIRDRLDVLERCCALNIDLLLPKARRWRVLATSLNVLAAALAAGAGATGLSDALTKGEIGLLALASAIVAAVNLGLGAGKVADDERRAVGALITLRAEVDSWAHLDLENVSISDAATKLNGFTSRLNDALALTLASRYVLGRQDRDSLAREPSPPSAD
jgi:hypothetical protein